MFTGIRLQGYRSFEDSGMQPLSALTVVIGENNTGKSTLLRAVYQVQQGALWSDDDVRIGHGEVRVELDIDGMDIPQFEDPAVAAKWGQGRLTITRRAKSQPNIGLSDHGTSDERNFELLPASEPDNLIYPALSGRRVWQPEEQVRREVTTTVLPTENNLVSRASVVMASRTPDGKEFADLCHRVLGDTLDLMTGANGQRLGRAVDRRRSIGLDAMGAGVGGVVGLLISLAGAHGKVFLVEEPENDLHPSALKALLDVIVEKSANNQFLVSTHSSIVLTHLGSTPGATVLRTLATEVPASGLPTSTLSPVEGRQGRLEVLRDLGYGLADFALGDGWLIFEESSAERLCRQFLIPWFVPELASLNLVAAAGAGRVGPLLQNLHEMTLFARLEPAYAQRLWVIADGDDAGFRATGELARRFADWPAGRFTTWGVANFEQFYPEPFLERAVDVLALGHDQRREPKKQLLNDVIDWIGVDEARAKAAFAESAADAITRLRAVAADRRPAEGA